MPQTVKYVLAPCYLKSNAREYVSSVMPGRQPIALPGCTSGSSQRQASNSKIAVVLGDDILMKRKAICQAGITEMNTGAPSSDVSA